MSKDATSETFVSFMSHLDTINLKSIKYYLVQSAKRIAIRLLYQTSKTISLVEEETKGTEESLYSTDIQKALNQLEDQERQIVIMKIEYGYKFAEIGKEIGISENAASSKYTRAIHKLRIMLGDDYE